MCIRTPKPSTLEGRRNVSTHGSDAPFERAVACVRLVFVTQEAAQAAAAGSKVAAVASSGGGETLLKPTSSEDAATTALVQQLLTGLAQEGEARDGCLAALQVPVVLVAAYEVGLNEARGGCSILQSYSLCSSCHQGEIALARALETRASAEELRRGVGNCLLLQASLTRRGPKGARSLGRLLGTTLVPPGAPLLFFPAVLTHRVPHKHAARLSFAGVCVPLFSAGRVPAVFVPSPTRVRSPPWA
jgi:hypothetical protein